MLPVFTAADRHKPVTQNGIDRKTSIHGKHGMHEKLRPTGYIEGRHGISINLGLSFHKPDKDWDKNFGVVRANSDIRLIVHKTL